MPRRAKRREADDPRVRRNITPTNPEPPTGGEVKAEKAISQPAGPLYLCPGPEWPPETTTCGRMLTHPGRCPECSKTRTRLRKAERRENKKNAAAGGQSQPETFELVLPSY